MKKTVLFVATLFVALSFFSNNCFAWPRSNKRYVPTTNQHVQSYTSSSVNNSSAQGVADTMARLNKVGHFGGHHPYYEGCGSGFSKESAYNNCCFANSGMATVDVGYARGSNGMWFCCRRYR